MVFVKPESSQIYELPRSGRGETWAGECSHHLASQYMRFKQAAPRPEATSSLLSIGAVQYLGVGSLGGLLGGLTGHDTYSTSVDGHTRDFYPRGYEMLPENFISYVRWF